MSKPYIHLEEALALRTEGRSSFRLLTDKQGCVAGCCSGITINRREEYSFDVHDDQEGFFVLEGEGFACVDGEEFPLYPGTSFIVAAGKSHGVITKDKEVPIKVFWFHSAIG